MRLYEYEEVTKPSTAYIAPIMGTIGIIVAVMMALYLPATENARINGRPAEVGKTMYEQAPGAMKIVLSIGVPILILSMVLAGMSMIRTLRVSTDEIVVKTAVSKLLPFLALHIPILSIVGMHTETYDAVREDIEALGGFERIPPDGWQIDKTNGEVTRISGDAAPFKVFRNYKDAHGVTFVLSDGAKVHLGTKHPDQLQAAVQKVLSRSTG